MELSKEVQDFLARLKTVRNKAKEEDVTTATVYFRAKQGVYTMFEIDGAKFILD